MVTLLCAMLLGAPDVKIVKLDSSIDSVDPGVRLFVHGATFPSTPDFDLEYKVPWEFNSSVGAYRLGRAEANNRRWDGEIPVQDKTEYREQDVQEAFNAAALATDPTRNSRNPPSLRAPNGVLEDSFYQGTGRRLWHAASIYVPTLVIAGEDDTWSFPLDREGPMRDLVNAPEKKHVTLPHATHLVLFGKQRFRFFDEIDRFLRGAAAAAR